MPDPRSVTYSREVMFGGGQRGSHIYDEYGRRPGQSGFKDEARFEREWRSFHRFQGEFARLFGPRRRGRSFQFMSLDREEDEEEFHQYHLGLEADGGPTKRRRRSDESA